MWFISTGIKALFIRIIAIISLLFLIILSWMSRSLCVTPKINGANQTFTRKERLRNDIFCEEWEDGVIYCRWIRCETGSADFFIEFVRKSRKNRGVIVDLRGNAGGSLPEGIAFAGLCYDEGAPLLTLYRDGDDAPVASIKNLFQRALNVPVVAIIDGNTMSTAEVVAGLIGSLPNGFLVGQRTAGDAVAIVDIETGYPPRSMEMRLKIQLQGRDVHNEGIEPDFLIPQTGDFRAQCLERSLLILDSFTGDAL